MSALAAFIHFLNLVGDLIQRFLQRKRLRKVRKSVLKELERKANERLNRAEQSRRRQYDISADPDSVLKDDGFRRD